MANIICFGEIMLRLAPPEYGRFLQADSFQAVYGGSESNVAVSLNVFGEEAAFVSKIPENDLGQAAINSLRQYGVDTSRVIRGGKRLGLYFLEKGASQRPSRVIYDRADSAIAAASAREFQWAAILKDAKWLHFSGITPALGRELADACLAACKEAKKQGLMISCDLNFRKNLWSREAFAHEMDRLLPFVDVCIANEEDAAAILKCNGVEIETSTGDYEKQEGVAAAFWNRYSFHTLAFTMRRTVSSSDNAFQAALYDGNSFYYSQIYSMHLVDRVGGGDSFSAGLIYALLHREPCGSAVEFAVAASCLKHSIEGDVNLASVQEVLALAEKKGSARVQR